MLFVFALASPVYAEVEEVPFDASKFNPETEDCFEMETQWFCKWDPYNNSKQGGQVTVPSGDPPMPPVVEEKTCPDRFELLDDECIPVRTVVVTTSDEEKFLEQLENIKERFEDRPPTSNAEKETYALVQELASCTRGSGSATGIQQNDRFVVSTTWINPSEPYLISIDLTGPHAELRKAVEECKAQHGTLEPVTLGRQYMDRVNDQLTYPDYYHADRPEVKELGAFPQINLNERSYITSGEDATDALCNHDLYGYDTKKDYNCFLEEKVDIGGTVSYSSAPYHKYMMYKTGDHAPNISVIHKNSGDSPVSKFITAKGGYQAAIDAIKWQQHFDLTGEALVNEHQD